MSVRTVARKDFLDTTRSRSLWALLALFVLVAVGIAVAYGLNPEFLAESGSATASDLLLFVASSMGLFVSIAAVVLCYKALAGERESGSVKLLLSLPHTRTEVVLGKLLGRGVVIGGSAGVAVLVAGAVGFALAGVADVLALAAAAAVTVAFGFVYAGIVVGLSATTGSTSRAVALVLGVFLLVEMVWDVVVYAAVWVAGGFASPFPLPEWATLALQLSPSTAYTSAIVAVVPDLSDAAAAGGTGVQVDGGDGGMLEGISAAPEVGVVVLLAWLVVPVAIGVWSFRRADL